jgi:hypothetical protein
VIPQPDGSHELERQRADIAAVFRRPREAPDAGQPRVLAVFTYAESLRVISRGALTSLDRATIDAVRAGARPGHPLPPREPGDYLAHVTDADVIITGGEAGRRAAVLFSHQHFPGIRFGHRFHPEQEGTGTAFALLADIETGDLHRMMEAPPSPDSDGIIWTSWGARLPGLEHQLTEIQAAFLGGWRAPGAENPRMLTERVYGEARRVLGEGGWTGLDEATVEAVRDGARPGDPLPPVPYINGVSDPDVLITGSDEDQRVTILFSYRDFPGVRFGHRFPPDDPGLDKIWLKEEIETGALDRLMETHPSADSTGIIWTTWENEDN